MRALRITGLDLNLFDFDYDLTWMAFFLGPDERIYGRYGGRDAAGPDTRNSLAGLRYAMQAALDAHARNDSGQPAPTRMAPVFVENMISARNFRGCIHCHQIKEIRRDDQITAGKWDRAEVFSYPLPENVGFSLEVDRGNVIRSVMPASPAARIDLQKGDVIRRLNGYNVNSFADAQYALHKAPRQGEISIAWLHAGESKIGVLKLLEGWRKTDYTWRASVLNLLPSLPFNGTDLPQKERKTLGLSAKQLAARLDRPVPTDLSSAGFKENDIIIGVDGQSLDMTAQDFLRYIRRSYLTGERITLNAIRSGKRLDLSIKLR